MKASDSFSWKQCTFDQLTSREVYLLAKLRIDVFVVEQACAYPELDGQDLSGDTTHILAMAHELPVAYARILAPRANSVNGEEVSDNSVYIGRVVVARSHRRQGLATTLMNRALRHCERHFAHHDQALAAQVTVESFYKTLGFAPCSEPYLEDGIAHVDMVRSKTNKLTDSSP